MEIHIAPYDSEWPEKFKVLREHINIALEGKAIAIEHIGSTSIVGLSAKPIIDIIVGVESTETLNGIEGDFTDIGFTYIHSEKHIFEQRRTFFKYKHDKKIAAPQVLSVGERDLSAQGFTEVAHVHCWLYNGPDWIRHLAFRDYLIANVEIRDQYQKFKEELSHQEWDSTLAYSQAKNNFIKDIQSQALV